MTGLDCSTKMECHIN